MEHQMLHDRVIAGFDFDRATIRELECISDQVDENLLHAPLVSEKNGQLNFFHLLDFSLREFISGNTRRDQEVLNSSRQLYAFRLSLRLEDDFNHFQDFVRVETSQVKSEGPFD